GTFDAAVLRKEADGGFTILGSPEGIERLGGIDVDAALFAHVTGMLGDAYAELDPDDEQAMAAVARLRNECTQAKEALSADTEAYVPVLLPTVQTEVRVTRGELEGMIRPTLAGTVTALQRALRSASLTPHPVVHLPLLGRSARIPLLPAGQLLLVGGSSRIPLVAGLVSAGVGRPVAVDARPKHSVALGAAIVAARAAGILDAGTPAAGPAAVAAAAGAAVGAGAGAAAGAATAGGTPPPPAGGSGAGTATAPHLPPPPASPPPPRRRAPAPAPPAAPARPSTP